MIPRFHIVIGCGHFGSRTIEKLYRIDSHLQIIVVDKIKEATKAISHLPAVTVSPRAHQRRMNRVE